MTDNETTALDDVREPGISALVHGLGVVGMIRFLQQFETDHGDYTAERQRRQDQEGPTAPGAVEALGEEIRREQAAGRLGPVSRHTRVLRP